MSKRKIKTLQKIARELCYPLECLQRLEYASTEREATEIMRYYRKEGCKCIQ